LSKRITTDHQSFQFHLRIVDGVIDRLDHRRKQLLIDLLNVTQLFADGFA
jgi:hypothetical protein